MARIEEKKEIKKEEELTKADKGRTALAIFLSVISVAILALIVTIVVMTVVKKKNENTDTDEEKTYEAIYTLDNTDQKLVEISWDEFDLLIGKSDDGHLKPELVKPLVYVFVYSPNTDTYTTVNNEELVSSIKEAIGSMNNLYVLNVLSDTNKDSSSSSVSAYLGSNGYNLVKIEKKSDEDITITQYNAKVNDVTEELNGLQ